MSKQLIFYDIEIFAHDALIVFKDINKKLVKSYHNKFSGLLDFVRDKTLVGYNNYFYDDKVITRMIDGYTPEQLKILNDDIIKRSLTGQHINPLIDSLDCFQQIDVSMPGLKKIEGNMGRMILESSVPFDIDRALTASEFNEVFNYCCYDVDSLIEVYKVREHGYFNSKEKLLSMIEDPHVREKAKKWNTTTISANILIPNKQCYPKKWASTRIPDNMWDQVPFEVQTMWEQVNKIGEIKTKTVTLNEFNCEIQFGFGGLHGAHKWKKRIENVKMLDVTSMYPNIILIIQALGAGSQKYSEILNKRIEIKHIDKIMSDALKLILNSAYGNLNNQYSILNNPRAAYSVCFYGQIALYELCKRLSATCEIININTDGVGFITDSEDYKQIAEEWEKEFLLKLEEDHFDLFLQKDVNNYIGVKDGKFKCKGGWVNRYEQDALFKNNNARILDIALVDKLVYGKDVLTSLTDHLDDPHLYQYILKAGGTYAGTFDDQGNQYNNVNRVFAAKRGDFLLQKKRYDGGLVRFADCPDKMYLWNDECSNLKGFENIIDLNHYYQIVNKRLESWE